MGVSKEIIEDIRARLDIVDYIGNVVPLKRAGTHTWKGLCPFHQEKTPSFHVNQDRQNFHCFGCGKGGDIFRFFMEKENVDFPEAVRVLASQAGVILPDDAFSKGEGGHAAPPDLRERMFKINEEFSRFFGRELIQKPDSPPARYLASRGISREIAEKFKIGAVPPGWEDCLHYGRSLGFTPDELVMAGICSRKAETGRIFDHFRGRLAFTIENEYGRAVGFSARSLEAKPQDGRKYINTSETPVFKKNALLYGLSFARPDITAQRKVILCEGQMDTIAFHRAGIGYACAPMGTAFTPNQAKILKRYADEVMLAFDADGAGQKAFLRAIEIILPLSLNLKVIQIPGGKDPDELFNQGGAEAVSAAVNAARPWLNRVCEMLPTMYDVTEPIGRGQAAVFIAQLLNLVTNQVELESYVQQTAQLLQVGESAIMTEINKLRMKEARQQEFRQQKNAPVSPRPSSDTSHRTEPAVLTLLELAIADEGNARLIADLLPPEEMPQKGVVAAALNLAVNLALNGEYVDLNDQLNDMLLKQPSAELSRILVEPTTYPHAEQAIEDSVAELRRVRANFQKKKYLEELRFCPDPERRLELLRKIQELK